MDLVNHTPVPASLLLSTDGDSDVRLGLLVAKATFRVQGGIAELERQRPLTILREDKLTELGLLPRDDLPRRDERFEVIMLANAYAPGGKATSQTVTLEVGGIQRRLAVFGDREWEGSSITAAAPYERMPLTYARAFGGTCAVEIDRGAIVDVTSPLNSEGRGFDPEPAVRRLAERFRPPPPYPVYERRRWLPNVEDPEALISRPNETPMPACWATVPLDSGIHAMRCHDIESEAHLTPGSFEIRPETYQRAHHDWIIDLPAERARVRAEGVHPNGPFMFEFPTVRVLADYVVGGYRGELELRPHTLVLLPDVERFFIVYREAFHLHYRAGAERSARLRVENGWWTHERDRQSVQ